MEINQPVTFALWSFVTDFNGRAIHVLAGEAWDADDAFVAAHPDAFGPRELRSTGRRIERATQAPGEVRRGPGRPRKSDA